MTQILMQMLDDNPDGTIQRRMSKKKLATYFTVYKMAWQKESQPYVAWFRLNRDQSFESAKKYFFEELDKVLKQPLTQRLKDIILKKQEVEESEIAQKMTSLVEFYESNEFFYNDFGISSQTRKIIQNLKTPDFHKWIKQTFNRKKSFHMAVTAPEKSVPCSEFEKSFASK